MISNFIMLSDYKNDSLSYEDKIEILSEKVDQNYKYTLVILFDKDTFEYKDIHLEETKEEGKKYVLISGSSAGTNYTPTAKITDIERTFENKIFKYFSNNKYRQKYLVIDKIYLQLKENKENILKKLKTFFSDKKSSKEKYLITIGFIYSNKEIYYLKDIIQDDSELSKFKEIILNSFEEDNSEIKGQGKCYSCDSFKTVVAKGFPLKFYTFDKINYISNGFKEKEMYKNFPLCIDCIYKIINGYYFIDNYLNFKLARIDYYLIPDFVINNNSDFVDTLKYLIKDYYNRKNTLSNLRKITEDENEILDYLRMNNIYILYNFLFYEKENNAFRIKLFIENTLPTTISKIFSVKEYIDRVFKGDILLSKITDKNLNKILGEEFKLDSAKDKVFNGNEKLFLKAIENIFKMIPISKSTLFKQVSDKLNSAFKSGSILETTIYVFKFYLFLLELNLIQEVIGMPEDAIKPEKIENINQTNIELAENFFNNFSKAFINDLFKFIFLEGVLTQLFIKEQQRRRGSSPFIKNIKNLKMNENDFKILYKELVNKIMEYDINYKIFTILKELVSYYYLKVGTDWKENYKNISLDEINFYFALGMSFSNYFENTFKSN
ncbi:MAG: TIGR02556 family CRISPR-associated protein [bacterium]|nr:TIGR02556 family CRISPR-associated protein [bacterium]